MENGEIGGIGTSKTLNRSLQNFGRGDYVGDITPHVKIQSDYPSGGVPANG